MSPDNVSVHYTKNRITLVYSPLLSQMDKQQFDLLSPLHPATYILTIDLYRLSQTPIIVPITAGVYSYTKLIGCGYTMGNNAIASTSLVCYHPAQQGLVQFPESILTPPLRLEVKPTNGEGSNDGDDDDDNDNNSNNHDTRDSDDIDADNETMSELNTIHLSTIHIQGGQTATIPLLHLLNEHFYRQSTISGSFRFDRTHPNHIHHYHPTTTLLKSRQPAPFQLTHITPPQFAQYESTTAICTFQMVDLFCTTVIQDNSFDRIRKDKFSYLLLLTTIVVVLCAMLYSRHRARISSFQSQWK